MNTHTPGPWYVEQPTGQTIRTHKPEAQFDSAVALVYGGTSDHNGERRRANAALVAAAPELYSIVQRLVAWENDPFRHYGDLADLAQDARAAIAKAEGRAPPFPT